MEPTFDFLLLPTELIRYTAVFIRYNELLELFKTSKRVRSEILHSDIFWKLKTYHDFRNMLNIQPHPDGWRSAYQCCRGVISLDFIKALNDDDAAKAEAILAINRKLRVLDPNIQDSRGSTPLMWVASKGYPETAFDELVEWGADINLDNDRGSTSLIFASFWGHFSIVKKLLKAGVDPNIQGEYGVTALIHAITRDHTPVVEELLENGSDANLRDLRGNTALVIASMRGVLPIVRALLKAGADPNRQDGEGYTPLYVATVNRSISMVRELLENGAKPRQFHPSEKSAIRTSLESGFIEITVLLVNKLAEISK